MSEREAPAEAAGPHDFHGLAQALADPRMRSAALSCLAFLAVLAALHIARDLVLPVVLAVILSLVFAPVVRGLRRARIPQSLGAGLIVFGLLGALLGGAYYLTEPAGAWLEKAPQGLRVIGVKLRQVAGSVQEVTAATEQVEDLTQSIGGRDERIQQVSLKDQSLVGTVLDAIGGFAVAAISTLMLLYFLLASGDLFLRKVVEATPRLADKKRAVDIARQIEAEVSIYLFTVTAINITLGCAVGFAMHLLGVPNPALWGAMVGLFNFVPYVGDLVSFSVLTVVGLLTFDDLWHGLLVPLVFYALTATEGYLLTPLVLSRRLRLNPVVIVLSMLFWVWMWGVPGALLAVPILVVLKTLFDRVDSLKVFGDFLGA